MKYTQALADILSGIGIAAYQESAKLVMIPVESGIVIYNYETWTRIDFFVPMTNWTLLV